MSMFVVPTKAPKPKTANIKGISLFYAGALTLLALLQLFHFEKFPERLATIGILPEVAPLLATFLVVFEVLALPFALSVRLSPAFRVVSMVAGWVVALKLLALAILENVTTPMGDDAVFGTTFTLPIGVWTICAALVLCVLAAWASWGVWPFSSRK